MNYFFQIVPKVRSVSRDHTNESGLSRNSALNDRYFDKPGRSRSLDNLLSPVSILRTKQFSYFYINFISLKVFQFFCVVNM